MTDTKTAVVTGGSRGIGSAIAQALAADGWQVAVVYHTGRVQAKALAAQLAAQYGVAAAAYGCDIADSAQVTELFRQVHAQLGEISLLVNNAGIAATGLFQDLTEEAWDRLFAVDVKGVFLCSRAVLPEMIRNQQGSIINLSSIWGITGASCEVAYSAAKAAVIGMTKALAKEAGPSHIRVNCVAPGVVATEMNRQLSPDDLAALCEETPLGRIGQPEEIAAAVAWLASEKAGFVTGQVLSPNGGMVI
ncbi:MAG: 3-oxoacyl-ACP reductase FabG [Angelakisella sp.]